MLCQLSGRRVTAREEALRIFEEKWEYFKLSFGSLWTIEVEN